jgi:CheY-like chemotaxis protein
MQVILMPPSFEYFSASYQMPPLVHSLSGGKDVSDPHAAATGDPSVQKKRNRPHALVVDDAPDVTEMIAMFLEHAGYKAVMAYSAMEALEAVQHERFDVIVSDIGMPGMNGYDLAIALRAMPEYDKVPMIAVTGFSMYDDRGRALESGFNVHMTKPINPMTLLEMIKSLTEG